MSLHVETIPNRNSPPTILLRRAWRDGHRIRKQTLANLTSLPDELVHGLRVLLRGGCALPRLDAALGVQRSLPHGHVAAVLGTLRQLGLERRLHRSDSRVRRLALGALVARVLLPVSKLATARLLSTSTAHSSLGALLGLGEVSGNEVLAMLDWLLKRQPWIERSLARQHLQGRTLLLYDVSSSYVEGHCNPLAGFGHNRDGKRSKRQIVFGLLCTQQGCPIAVEVFSGSTADPNTLSTQIIKLRRRFGLTRIALVGDRGMLTSARIRDELLPAEWDWISALKTSQIRRLAQRGGPLSPAALAADQVATIRSPDFPGERLLVCLNPRLRQERRRKREALLKATETLLAQIATLVERRRSPLRGRDRIGREANRYRVEKHFHIEIGEDHLRFSRKTAQIEAEAALDGLYVVRTSLPSDELSAAGVVEAYKSLAHVERAFRSLKSLHLRLRPLFVYSEAHVRAHVFLCMLAYYLTWHLRRRLAPLLFEDDDPDAARAQRCSPLAPARPSPAAQAKTRSRKTSDGFPLHSFPTLLADLATVNLNEVTLTDKLTSRFQVVTTPTPLQQKAFDLLQVTPARMFPVADKL